MWRAPDVLRALPTLKRSAILVNTARGALMERDALVDALRQRKIAGTGLDVFHDEPLKPDDPLLALDNVVLCPLTSAGQTPEVTQEGLRRAADNVAHLSPASTPETRTSRWRSPTPTTRAGHPPRRPLA